MCGIAGIINKNQGNIPKPDALDRMLKTIIHRGPDEEGIYRKQNINLGMRRLSIIDVANGHQPLMNEEKNIIAVYNGEIYNFQEIKEQLLEKGHVFKANSDGEIIVHGYEEWGIDGILKRINGIFGFSLWDERNDTFYLVRDRLGVKPLYYYSDSERFVFSSEIKSILASGLVPLEINNEALMLYLRYQFTAGSHTLLQEINRVEPGTYIKGCKGEISTINYWQPPESSINHQISFDEASNELQELLVSTVRDQMLSDVPIGLFLSGGLDSSILAYLMSQESSSPINTFSISFPNQIKHDEKRYSEQVAKEINSNHTDIVFDSSSIINGVESILNMMDEPIADPAILPTYLLSKEASQTVKVVLSGEGADEVFGGYNYYKPFLANNVAKKTSQYTSLTRNLKVGLSTWMKTKKWIEDPSLRVGSPLSGFPYALSDNNIHQLLNEKIRPGDVNELKMLLDSVENNIVAGNQFETPLQRAMTVDSNLWLSNDILMKLDNMTMANSIEGRVPFLNHEIVEWAFNLPDDFKFSNNAGKRILRSSMKGLVPDWALERKKHGFNIPLYDWFQGPLKGFLFDTLTDDSVRQSGYFDPKMIEALLHSQINLGRNAARILWSLICFIRWFDSLKDVTRNA